MPSQVRKHTRFTLLVLGALLLSAGLSREVSGQGVVNVSAQSLGGSPGSSRHPHLAFDSFGVLHVVWADDTGSPGAHQIRYARSFDGGVSFTPAIQLSFGNAASLRPRLAVFQGVAYVVWMQDPDSGGAKEIYFAAVVDGNRARGPVNISETDGISQEARIAVDGFGRIFVVWDESSSPDAPFRHIALARSFDAGASFVKSVVASIVTPSITSCPPGSVGNCLTVYPGVAVDPVNGNVYAVWHDRVGGPTGEYQIFFTRSVDAGTTFSAPLQISSAPIHAHCAAITVGPSGRILIAYETRKEVGTNNHFHDSEYQQSTDYGVSFGAPVNMSRTSSQILSDYPWPVEAHDGTIFVGWEDSRFEQLDAVYAVSRDGGGSFGEFNSILQNPGTSTEVVTAFARDGTALAIWEDEEAGEDAAEIYLARIPGLAGPAPGGIQLAIRSNQLVYRTGETLTLGVGAYNTGGARAVDVYFALLMPGAAGPALGCPGGDALQVYGDFFASRANTCLSRVPQNTPALLRSFVIPGGMPETAFPNLFVMPWTPGLAPGVYTFIVAVMPAGALNDGRLDPGDVLAVATQQVLFSP